MATKLKVAIDAALEEALEQKLADFDVAVVSSRIDALVRKANEAGFVLTGRIFVGQSLPYLVVYAKFKAKYSSYTLESTISVWNDGEAVVSIVNDDDVTLFWARAFISGQFAQTLNIDRLLRG